MNNQNEKAAVNKVASILYTILGTILFAAYILEIVKGSKTVGQVAILGATDMIPIIVCWILYKLNPPTDVIKHVMALGYGIFYLATIIITEERLVFVYAIPMVVIVTLFNDTKYATLVGILVSVFSAIHAVKMSTLEGWSTTAIAQTEIEVLVMIVFSAFMIVCSRTIVGFNKEKMDAVSAASEKTENLFKQVMDISNNMIADAETIAEKMEQLSISSEETLSAMQEVSTGSTETAESVQTQLYKTEEIQNQVSNVKNASSNIGSQVDAAVAAIDEGRSNLDTLIKQAQISEDASNGVIKEVEELVKSTEQMQSIVDLINNVASQTSLLALNASIEAARAGEAGRGFAVVSTEISNLANQTQSATSSISSMIDELSKEMADVTKAINSLIESNKIQNESAAVTATSFQKIVAITDDIRACSDDLAGNVSTLEEANNEIVESIQTISAITEEVSAHSNTTCESTEQNKVIVGEAISLVEALNSNASVLKGLQ